MSEHWRVAARYAVLVLAGAAVSGVGVWVYFGGTHAGSFWYGAGVGLASFVSTALSVSLLTSRSPLWRAVGGGSFVVRYGVVAAALGVPAYLGAWPIVAMLGGFAGVYLLENVLILPAALGAAGRSGANAGGQSGGKAGGGERMEKRVIV